MVQNLKVDIIYHLTPSDFEMEFNLCGCCRMRLLNDKTTDKKTLVKSLARAVSRSRIIMVCGPLFGEDGVIKTVAAAIGSTTALCDNATYGINTDDTIEVINGSTPLVTPDGYFGGCIIESGPQTIILLTENRSFRKKIMQNLIHAYIEDISYMPTKTVLPSPKVEEVTVALSENEDYITTPDDEYEKDADSIESSYESVAFADEHNIEFIMDGETEEELDESPQNSYDSAVVDEVFDRMYTEVESEAEIKERYENVYVPSEGDNMFVLSDEDENGEIKKEKSSKFKATDVLTVVLILVLLLSV